LTSLVANLGKVSQEFRSGFPQRWQKSRAAKPSSKSIANLRVRPSGDLIQSVFGFKWNSSRAGLKLQLEPMMSICTALGRAGFVFAVAIVLANCQPSSGQELSGNWTGRWQSSTNNHGGKMNATFVQQSGDQLQVKFRGSFAKVIPFRYRAKLNVVYQEPGLTIVGGSKKLGPLMGDFSYSGQISNGCFTGTYSSRRYNGSWVTSRN
jgi:hypothetical protein